MNTLTIAKATIYFLSPFGLGYQRVEVKNLCVWRAACAQFTNAIFCEFLKKGARKWRSRIDPQCSHPSLVVLEGWGHPEPSNFKVVQADETVIVEQYKHRSCSPQWDADFGIFLAAYLKRCPGVRVAADFRGANTRENCA